LPVDFVFFRTRSDGSIADLDYLLPGFEQAKREIVARKRKVRIGEVKVPVEGEVASRHTWKQAKGSVAATARMKHVVESLKHSKR
jgi:hypothetical protein